MTPKSVAQAFADATAALTQDHDVTHVLAYLVRDCMQLLSAAAIGILVVNAQSEPELLTATSHGIADLELFQIQHDSGPCLDAIATGILVSVIGRAEIDARWPRTGPAISEAGYRAVHAYPLRWHGYTIGAMNIFHADPDAAPTDLSLLGQAFADIATVVIVQTAQQTPTQITSHIEQALQARTLIEQAKGVLGYQHNLDMAAAYEMLLTMTTPGSTLSAAATDIIAHALGPEDLS